MNFQQLQPSLDVGVHVKAAVESESSGPGRPHDSVHTNRIKRYCIQTVKQWVEVQCQA